MLSMWKTTLMELELKGNAKPVCSKTYPLPTVHKKMLKKEVERIVTLRLLEEANKSKWGAPSFAQPKAKTNREIILTEFKNLNRKFKYKPCPIPKIREMLLNLKGFQYDMSLDLNVVYYHTRLSKYANSQSTIILPWGKYKYKRLPMGAYDCPDISKQE